MLPDKAKFVVCSIISLALSFWMKHLVIGQLQKPANFSAFHWSTSRSQAFVGQLLGTSRSTFTESDRNGLIYHIGCLITLSDRNGLILVLVSTDFDHTGCLITLSDRNGPILDLVYPILTIFLTKFQPILADLITESDKAVHSCKCWFQLFSSRYFQLTSNSHINDFWLFPVNSK